MKNIDLIKNMDKLNKKAENKLFVHDYFGANIWIDDTTREERIVNCIERADSVGFNSYLIPFYHKIDNNILTQIPSDSIIKFTIDKIKEKNPKFLAIKIHISPNSKSSFPEDFMSGTYVNVVKRIADICKEKDVENLFISNEQNFLTKQYENEWDNIINYCHGLGIKCFSSFAGFDDFKKSIVIKKVDGIGINYYPPAAINKITNKESVKNNLDNLNNKQYLYIFNQIRDYLNKDIPIFISEIGCCNNIDSLAFPYASNFDEDIKKEEYQAYYYNAFLSEIGCNINIPIKGLFVWSIGDTKNRANSNNFSPLYNIECEEVIKKYMGK